MPNPLVIGLLASGIGLTAYSQLKHGRRYPQKYGMVRGSPAEVLLEPAESARIDMTSAYPTLLPSLTFLVDKINPKFGEVVHITGRLTWVKDATLYYKSGLRVYVWIQDAGGNSSPGFADTDSLGNYSFNWTNDRAPTSAFKMWSAYNGGDIVDPPLKSFPAVSACRFMRNTNYYRQFQRKYR